MFIEKLLSICVRFIPLAIILIPLFFAFEWLSNPIISYFMTLTMCILFTVSTILWKFNGDKMFATTLLPAIILSSLLISYHANIISIKVFVYVAGSIGMLGATLVALLSTYIGKGKNKRLGHILTFISLLSPLVVSCIVLITGSGKLYKVGIICSICASAINIFFNKDASSVGVAPK